MGQFDALKLIKENRQTDLSAGNSSGGTWGCVASMRRGGDVATARGLVCAWAVVAAFIVVACVAAVHATAAVVPAAAVGIDQWQWKRAL